MRALPILMTLLIIFSCASKDEQATEIKEEVDLTNYSFKIGSTDYMLVKQNKTWLNAAQFAIAEGGYLAEINSQSEQTGIFRALKNNANISLNRTTAGDGGDASYVWIGANDIANEGTWVWDGDDTGSSIPFWEGTANGQSINGQYSNWGQEPDDFNGQDCLGLALSDWPFGIESEWNDLNQLNLLYFLIEF